MRPLKVQDKIRWPNFQMELYKGLAAKIDRLPSKHGCVRLPRAGLYIYCGKVTERVKTDLSLPLWDFSE